MPIASAAAAGEGDESDPVDGHVGEELLLEVGATAVTEADIRQASGAELERWKRAAAKELQESFFRMVAASGTKEELGQVGGMQGQAGASGGHVCTSRDRYNRYGR